MTLAMGTKIGGHEIVALVGAGGIGEVYRARDARLARDVAIRVVSPAIATDADGLMRFEREPRMLASLRRHCGRHAISRQVFATGVAAVDDDGGGELAE